MFYRLRSQSYVELPKMQHVDPRHLNATRDKENDFGIDDALLQQGLDYAFRIGRAAAYGLAGYLLVSIQSHFTFSFAALSLTVFSLALVRRSLILAETVLVLLIIATFLPAELIQAINSAF